MKKIIMLLSKGFNPDVRVYKEAKTLVKKDYDVTIIAWDRLKEYPKKEIIEGINIERITLKSVFCAPFLNLVMIPLFWLCILFKLFSRDFDAIHCHDFDTLPVGVFIGKLRRKKIIYDAHEQYNLMIARSPKMPKFLRPFFIITFDIMEKFFIRLVDYVITVNQINIRDKYQQIKNKVIVANFPESSFFKKYINKKLKDNVLI